jgi:hypothetical protein
MDYLEYAQLGLFLIELAVIGFIAFKLHRILK